MKRLLIAAMGLTGVLASCGVDIVVGSDPVTITQLNSYTSDYYYNRVENGNTVREYVICADRDTKLYVDASWTGPLSQFASRFTYTKPNGSKQIFTASTNVFAADRSGRDTFTYTIAQGVLNGSAQPLSITKGAPSLSAQTLKAQAIVVTPVNQGNVAVDLWGYNPNAVKSAELRAPQAIPVVASCN